MSQTVVLKVGMSCQGCVGAVNRVLGKLDGVESYDINIEQQKVTVRGTVPPEKIFQTVSKTGKKTEYWEAEPEAKPEVAEAKPEVAEVKPAEAEAKPEETEAKPAETVAAA